MNRILRFIYAALIVSTAVACHTSEIDNPNNDNQDKPKAYDNIILTASIKQTRVDYSINGDKLEQRWAENDVIYGFYGDTKAAKDKKIVFTVNSVDESGVASLSPGDGWSDFLSVYKGGNLAIRLVYTGCTTTELSDLFEANGDILIDMTEQGTGRIPACMHADSYAERTDDDITYIQFQFDNDCSIIEVFSFTGVKEDSDHYFDGASATLGSIVVDGLIEGCKYSLDNNGDLQFESIDNKDDEDAPTTVTLGGDWSVTKDGDITYDGNIKPVFIAAVPYIYTQFTVSANLDNAKTNIIQSFSNKTFVGGNSYYIMADPVVAKTVDNVYFKTVYDAFEHAEELSDRYTTAADNVVTLIKKEIDGLGTPESGWWNGEYDVALMIDIDYNVTLDLNGCTLYLNYSRDSSGNIIKDEYNDPVPSSDGVTSGAFYVSSGKSFKIQDSSEGDGECRSCSNCTLVINKGNTIVSSGNVYHTLDSSAVHNYGNLTVEGGNVYSCYGNAIINDGDAKIKGGLVDSYSVTILNHNKLKVQEEGEVTSYGSAAICSEGGTVNITGGYIHADCAEAIKIYGGTNCDISGGIIAASGVGVGTISFCGGNAASTLIIRWPEGTSNPSPDSIQEPLIYSGDENSATSVPVSTFIGQGKTQSAQITIEGGYLISSNTVNLFLYDASGDNLKVWDTENDEAIFGNFYSNMKNIRIYQGKLGTFDYDLTTDPIYGHSFNANEQDGDGFTMPEIGGSTGALYKIDPAEDEPAEDEIVYPGTEGLDLEPVEIGGVVWAPVNCGYDADHPYGLLYQWGRKYGQGYDGEEGEPELVDLDYEPLSEYPDQDDTNAGKFYTNSGYSFSNIYKLWDSNDSVVANPTNVSQQNPAKTTNDPCPKGWRVPTCYDFLLLGDEDLLPPAGMRYESGEVDGRGDSGYYWTSSVDGDFAPSPWCFTFPPSFGDSIIQGSTLYGCSIRCVKE